VIYFTLKILSFFRQVKAGEKPVGYSRFRGRGVTIVLPTPLAAQNRFLVRPSLRISISKGLSKK